MQVLIDARKLGHGGIGVYIDNLISGLIAQHDVYVSVLVNPKRLNGQAWLPQVQVVEDHANPYSLDEMLLLGRRLNQRKFDLYHSPHFTLPLGILAPSIVTLHDLIHVYHPEKSFYPILAGILIRSALLRARRILTVSEATRADISRFVRHDDRLLSKVRVVPNAINPYFVEAPIIEGYLQSRFRIEPPFLLSVVSLLKPHKGFNDLLEVWEKILAKIQSWRERGDLPGVLSNLKLVIVGQGAEKLAEHDELLRRTGDIRDLHVLGKVSEQDLLHLYQGAMALLMVSKAEGFCLPVLEAKTRRVPVVARPVPAVLELLNKEDVTAADFSVGAFVDVLQSFLRRESERVPVSRPLSADPSYADRFSRASIAQEVLSVYREAVQEKR